MKAKIRPTENVQRLKENIEKRVETATVEEGKLIAEVQNIEFLEKTPGIESFKANGEEKKGIGGQPVEEEAYARIESRKDAVKALLATIKGYDLRILDTGRSWDLRNLKKYNPDIKHLKFKSPKDFLGIEKSVQEIEGKEKIELEVPDKKVETIYREMLT